MVEQNYRVKPQVRCGAYRIDFVVEGSEGRRLAIECDGDKYHGPGQWMNDMTRQRVLERAGWVFCRCFASGFVMRKQEVFLDLLATLNKMDVDPLGSDSVDNTQWVRFKEVDPYQIMNGTDEAEEELALPVSENSGEIEPELLLQNGEIFALSPNIIESPDQRKLVNIESSEIQQTILNILTNCPNQSCTLDSITTRVLKELGIITRGKARIEFEGRVSKSLWSLIRNNKVEKYKSKNERIRLHENV